jgi:hypothetical protein
MTPYEIGLLELYVAHGADAMRADQTLAEKKFGRTTQELAADSAYQDTNSVLADIADSVGSSLTLQVPGPRAKLAGCLKLLLSRAMFATDARLVFEYKFDMLREYLVRKFGANGAWTADQREHFDFVSEIIKAWKTYFLSYTNRDSAGINQRFNDVISSHVRAETRGERDATRQNILADAVVHLMTKQNLCGSFYDREAIAPATPLEPVIEAAARGVFSLLQLVERETFIFAPPPNWCYFEYKVFDACSRQMLQQRQRYKDVFRKRFCALLTCPKEQLKVPAAVPDEYKVWIHRIFVEQRYVELPTDPSQFEALVETIAATVCNVQNEIIEAVPP